MIRYNHLGWFLPSLLMSTPALCGEYSGRGDGAEECGRKNVLLLIVDDLRPELNCYGATYMHTPNIDRLAREGVMFENAYCNIPVSGASRASLMTGLRPGLNRFWDVQAEIDLEVPGTVTLPQHFRENGYRTIANSKIIHAPHDAEERSWDEVWFPELNSTTWRDYLDPENIRVEKQRGGPAGYECREVGDNAYSDGKTADKTIEDLRRLAASGEPFFLASGILKPHLPFTAPKPYWDLYDPESIELPATADFDREGFPAEAFHRYNEIRYYRGVPSRGDIPREEALRLIRGYRACVSYADAQVGRILDELRRLELDKNTIVVLLGDHGWSLGDHNQWCKHSNFNIVTHAPLMIRIPGNPRHGVEDKVVEFVDVYPTLCEAAGLPLPEHLEGESMVRLMSGKDPRWKDCAIVKWHSGVSYFDREWGYTRWEDRDGKFRSHMLFRYGDDSAETRNVVDDPGNRKVVKRLHGEILKRRGKDFLKLVNRSQKPWNDQMK